MRPKNPRLEVLHPTHCETVKAVPYPPEDPKSYFVLVQGRKVGGIKELFGLLVDPSAPDRPHVPTFVSDTGATWALGFADLPMEAKPYILVVGIKGRQLAKGDATTHRAKWHCVVTVEFSVEGLRVAKPVKGARPKDKVDTITVLYPPPNGTVCPTFVAYGLQPSTDAESAMMGTTITGTSVPGPNGIWMFQFTNVPTGDYDFTVTNNAGANGGSADVTVDPMACAPVVGPPPPPP